MTLAQVTVIAVILSWPVITKTRRHITEAQNIRDSGLGGKIHPLTNDLLHTHLPKGQIVSRGWLLYSPSNGTGVLLFMQTFFVQETRFTDGFSD